MVLAANTYQQDATYWGSPQQSNFGGYVFAAPVAKKVRWENAVERYTDMQGDELISKAIVYTLFEPVVGGYLFFGTSVAASPEGLTGAHVIRRVDTNTDLRNLHQTYKVWL